jgi:catechol 2,3-dioxygenase-like lactoylglutathione lyase family enzyme
MYTHAVLGAKNVAESKQFYDAVLTALGHRDGIQLPDGRVLYQSEMGALMIGNPINGEDATFGNGSTLGFAAPSEQAVEACHAAGVKNGGKSCEDPPGIRVVAGQKMYLAYLRDPSGNKLCINFMMGPA